MSGNSFGKLFCVTSFGESHGAAIGGVIDGCPAGLSLSEKDLQTQLDRRKPGASRFTSQRREQDTVQILSGVFEGYTTGTPIGLLIYNQAHRQRDYQSLEGVFRPGHGDYTYFKKYGHRDYRGGGRASARETAIRVAAGAIAKKFLYERAGITIRGYLAQMGKLAVDYARFSWDTVENNPFFCPDPIQVEAMAEYIEQLRREGDSIGAKVCVEAAQVPVGLGEPVYDKLDAVLAKALMSINAVKAVEIGDGVAVVQQRGSFHRDAMSQAGFLSNHAGGILAGISTGQPILASITLKPPSSIVRPVQTIDKQGQETMLSVRGRHDPCVGIRAVPVAEAMVALVIMDHWLTVYGQKGGACG